MVYNIITSFTQLHDTYYLKNIQTDKMTTWAYSLGGGDFILILSHHRVSEIYIKARGYCVSKFIAFRDRLVCFDGLSLLKSTTI